MARTALVKDGAVAEIVMAGDGYQPPAGFLAVASRTANVGDTYDGAVFKPPLRVRPKAELANYASVKQTRVAGNGITVDIAAGGKPLLISVDTSAKGRADLSGLVQAAIIDPNFTTNWHQSSGDLVLTAEQIKAVHQQVTAFIADTYKTLSAVLSAIELEQIISTEGVDNPPAPLPAWPANS
jgi:hypothetical protein